MQAPPAPAVRGYWRFFRRETPLLTYGLSLTFLSSVGQTFLVSLFVPFFLRDFALSEGGFGVLYAGATLGSALLLPVLGRQLDRTHLHRFTLGVVALLAGSAFLMASASHLAVLGVALLGVRLGGQGLSSHTALTTMARYYEAARGYVPVVLRRRDLKTSLVTLRHVRVLAKNHEERVRRPVIASAQRSPHPGRAAPTRARASPSRWSRPASRT